MSGATVRTSNDKTKSELPGPLEQTYTEDEQRVNDAHARLLDDLKLSADAHDIKVFAETLVNPSPESKLHKKLQETIGHCASRRGELEQEALDNKVTLSVDDEQALADAARFTDALPLRRFEGMLRYVPRLVNVVTLAQVKRLNGSKLEGGLPLEHIARHCTGAFFSPKRFAAVQLAFRSPRCRILVFETGKLVGTGCASIIEARLATLLACRQMALQAGVHVCVDSFEVVNTMGAVAMHTTIDCEGFQAAHSATTMLDRSSFVGMTWRPSGEPICIEIYSTGRANVSKARTYRELLLSFSKLVPELLRRSSSSQGAVDSHENEFDDHNSLEDPSHGFGLDHAQDVSLDMDDLSEHAMPHLSETRGPTTDFQAGHTSYNGVSSIRRRFADTCDSPRALKKSRLAPRKPAKGTNAPTNSVASHSETEPTTLSFTPSFTQSLTPPFHPSNSSNSQAPSLTTNMSSCDDPWNGWGFSSNFP